MKVKSFVNDVDFLSKLVVYMEKKGMLEHFSINQNRQNGKKRMLTQSKIKFLKILYFNCINELFYILKKIFWGGGITKNQILL